MNWKNLVSYGCKMSVKKVGVEVKKGLISLDMFVSRSSLVGNLFFPRREQTKENRDKENIGW